RRRVGRPRAHVERHEHADRGHRGRVSLPDRGACAPSRLGGRRRPPRRSRSAPRVPRPRARGHADQHARPPGGSAVGRRGRRRRRALPHHRQPRPERARLRRQGDGDPEAGRPRADRDVRRRRLGPATLGGRIDLRVNGAGVTGTIETPVWEITGDDWDHVLAVNLRGTFLPTKHVLPTMIAQRDGKIVNISGTSGLRGYKYRAAYSASKWALRGFTRTVALEVGPYNVNVNAVHPGIVAGDRMDRLCREK